MTARYYDPQTQRFLSKDPIEFEAGDFNFYRYVGGDPVNYVDPTGLFEQPNYNQVEKLNYPNKVPEKKSIPEKIWSDIKTACAGFHKTDLPLIKIGKDVVKAVQGGAEGLNSIQNLDLNKHPEAAPFVNLVNTSKYTADMAVRGKHKIIDSVKHFNPTKTLPTVDNAVKQGKDKYETCMSCFSDDNVSK